MVRKVEILHRYTHETHDVFPHLRIAVAPNCWVLISTCPTLLRTRVSRQRLEPGGTPDKSVPHFLLLQHTLCRGKSSITCLFGNFCKPSNKKAGLTFYT